MPYKDLFDQNWPGIIWLSQFASAVFGDSPAAMRYFDLIWQTLSCFILFRLSRREIQQNLIWGPVFFYVLLYFAASFGGTAQREGFASLFLGAAMLCWGGAARAFISGLLIGAAILIKPTLAAVGGVLCLVLCVSLVKKWNRARFNELAGVVLGMGSVLTGFAIFLRMNDLLHDFIDAGVVFAATYSSVGIWWAAKRAAEFFILYPPGRLAVAIILLTAFNGKKKELFTDSKILIIFAIGTFLSLLVQKRLAYYHAMPFCYFGSLLIFKLLAISQDRGHILGLARKWALVTPLFFVFPVGYDLPKSILSVLTMTSDAEYSDSRRAQRNLLPWQAIIGVRNFFLEKIDNKVQVIVISGASGVELYYAANRPPVQKYISPAHFLFDQRRTQDALTAIRNNKSAKAVIVDSKYLTQPPLLLKPLSAFLTEIFNNKTKEKVFSETYGGAKIDIYLLEANDASAKA